ncbi:MAG: SMC-Scp complex subunit ScpB, partial [Thermoanaerobaculia bacterium]
KNEGRLSLAALETMAIVAYRQPITVPEINDIRGVNSSGVIRTLLDRKMIKIAGRKNVVGSPFLYRTTRDFLLHFGLESIQDLPKLEEFSEILGESLADELLTSMSEEDILDAPPDEDGEQPAQASADESEDESDDTAPSGGDEPHPGDAEANEIAGDERTAAEMDEAEEDTVAASATDEDELESDANERN